MSERNLDFNTVPNREGTRCLKYDFKKERGLPEDVLPLWVADMDFKVSSYIEDAIKEQALHGIYGYTEVDDEFVGAVQNWVLKHYHRETKKEWFHKSPSVVFSIAMAVQAYTEAGEAVLINQPVYYPFSGVIRDNGRRVVSSDLVNRGDGYYTIDFEDFEKKIEAEKPKLYILCSPHNPVGRVWDKEELNRIGEICKKHGVTVFADEIHADFVWGKEFTTFANAGEGFDDFSVTAVSPSKSFNIAGLQVSGVFIPNFELYKKFHYAYDASGYSQLNAAGIAAGEAAYLHGEEWLSAAKKAIEDNLDFAVSFIETRLPEVRVRKPEGTYLLWLDFRMYGFTDKELNDLIIHKAKLWLDSGAIFGRAGAGYQRINVACPRATLEEALIRIEKALRA